MILKLSINKFFYDKILNNEKLVEFRGYKPYYISRLKTKKTKIYLYYYSGTNAITADITNITIIKTPLNVRPFVQTKKCFKISFKNPKEVSLK